MNPSPTEPMSRLTALRFDRDRDVTADIVPEAFLRCSVVRELSFPWASAAFERQFTEIRAGWTDKFLYIHLWAKDSWVAAKETKAKGPVYRDDCLEVFLMPEEGLYWGWEINALGTCLDYRVQGWGDGVVEERHIDLAWKTAAQWKARRHDAGWALDLKIPFAKDLARVPQRGDVWRATFNRLDLNRQGNQSLSTFSALAVDSPVWFHQPLGFGQLLFS